MKRQKQGQCCFSTSCIVQGYSGKGKGKDSAVSARPRAEGYEGQKSHLQSLCRRGHQRVQGQMI